MLWSSTLDKSHPINIKRNEEEKKKGWIFITTLVVNQGNDGSRDATGLVNNVAGYLALHQHMPSCSFAVQSAEPSIRYRQKVSPVFLGGFMKPLPHSSLCQAEYTPIPSQSHFSVLKPRGIKTTNLPGFRKTEGSSVCIF